MDYSHNPYLIYAIATLGALFGVLVAVGAFLMMRGPRRPRGPGHDGPAGPAGPSGRPEE